MQKEQPIEFCSQSPSRRFSHGPPGRECPNHNVYPCVPRRTVTRRNVGTSSSSDLKSMNTLKYLFIFISVVLYTSSEHSQVINSENYGRVIAAHLNSREPFIIVWDRPATPQLSSFRLFKLIERLIWVSEVNNDTEKSMLVSWPEHAMLYDIAAKDDT